VNCISFFVYWWLPLKKEKADHIKIEVKTEDGEEITLIVKGKSTLKKINFNDFLTKVLESSGSKDKTDFKEEISESSPTSPVESKQRFEGEKFSPVNLSMMDRVRILTRNSFGTRGWFTSSDLIEVYRLYFKEDLKPTTAATYLRRMCEEDLLEYERDPGSSRKKYRLTSEALLRIPEADLESFLQF